ncbi:hypothetical protein EMIT0111MI5_20592 [Burkholderia sp. IT-111MI5]
MNPRKSDSIAYVDRAGNQTGPIHAVPCAQSTPNPVPVGTAAAGWSLPHQSRRDTAGERRNAP